MKLSDFTETIILVAIGIVLHLLQLKELGNVAFLLGPALSAQRRLITRKIEAEVEPVHKLAEVMDLSRELKAQQFSELQKTYLQITQDEFTGLKDEILQQSIRGLNRLVHSKQSEPLAMGAYYAWLLDALRNVDAGMKVWAVSTMMETEWDDSPQEEEFLRLNLEVPERGAELERIFVVPDSIVPELGTNPGVAAHREHLGPRLRAWVVSRDKLERDDPELLRGLRDGWIAFDEKVALIDELTSTGARGFVSMASAEIGRLRRMFDQLRVQGRTLDKVLSVSESPKQIAPSAD